MRAAAACAGWSSSAGGFGERGTDDERRAGPRGAARARRGGPRARHARGRAELPRHHQHRPRGPAQRVAGAAAAAGGRAGFFCQSGALGVAVLGEAARRGLGVSTFVSAGNRADVSGNDLLQYWETDPSTDVVLMYLESFGNPRKFARLARRLGRTKPIVAVKGGAGVVVAGLAYTSVEVPEVSVRALFEASGVIRVDTVGDLFDVALLLTSQPLPAVTAGGGGGQLDRARARWSPTPARRRGCSSTRLDDIGVEGPAADLERTLRRAARRRGGRRGRGVRAAAAARAAEDEVAAALRTRRGSRAASRCCRRSSASRACRPALAAAGRRSPARGSVPSYASPERAVRALARAVRYAVAAARPRASCRRCAGVDLAAARAVVARVLRGSPGRARPRRRRGRPLLGRVGVALVDACWPRRATASTSCSPCTTTRRSARWSPSACAGVATELLGDRAYAPVAAHHVDADDLIRAPRAAPLLTATAAGSRSTPAALADVALRLSALADALPEIAECTLRCWPRRSVRS